MAKNSLPSFFNYNRSVSSSEALLAGLTPDGKTVPVQIIEKGIRGAISSYSNVYKKEGKSEDDKNIAKQLDPENANLQVIDVAYLPHGADRLSVSFSVVVQANALSPTGCNDAGIRSRIVGAAARYAEIGGFHYLAERYTWNLINGRVLWRNRFASEKTVKVKTFDGKEWTFAGDRIPLAVYPGAEKMPQGFGEVAALVGDALAGKSGPLFLEVEIVGRMPMGAEVYPSQEFIGDGTKDKERPSRVLSSIPVTHGGEAIRQASIHSQKIGNAIRTIDEWHGQLDEYGTTAVECFGYVQSRNAALRLPKSGSADVYQILSDLDRVEGELSSKSKAADLDGDIHYLMAVLVRGGVFSGSKKD